MERPSTCLSGCLLPLANFNAINFAAPTAGVSTPPQDVEAFQLDMTDDGGGVIAQSSQFRSDGSFAVSRVFAPPPWILDSGAASDVSFGADGSLWILGTNTVPGGHGIFAWTGTSWAEIPGGAVHLAIGPDGSPWVTNSYNQIFHLSGNGWVLYPGAAIDIAIGADGSQWVIGTNTVPGGHGIFTWTGTRWTEISGGAIDIAVAPDSALAVVNGAHQIFSG
jgi:hypothetical protein